jgi:hypothetical protein
LVQAVLPLLEMRPIIKGVLAQIPYLEMHPAPLHLLVGVTGLVLIQMAGTVDQAAVLEVFSRHRGLAALVILPLHRHLREIMGAMVSHLEVPTIDHLEVAAVLVR